MTRAADRLGSGIQKLSSSDFGVLRNPGVESVQLVWGRNAPDAKITVTRVTMDPGTAQKPHAHAQAEQTWIVESGQATVLVGEGRNFTIKAGDVVRTPAGCTHALVNDNIGPFVYLTITTPAQDFTASYGLPLPQHIR